MADHVLSLSIKQEAAAQMIVDGINLLGAEPITLDAWLKGLVLGPIRNKIEQLKADDTALVATAYNDATKVVRNQVNQLLGIGV